LPAIKHLEIANYPPPYDGWGTHTKFVVDELRRRGHVCEVLKINENRRLKSAEYVDVQGGVDYLTKVIRFAARGYSVNAHLNAESRKGYILALVSVLIGRVFRRKATITFHGGVPQTHFPRPPSSPWHWKLRALFHVASGILCDSDEIKRHIASYGIPEAKIATAYGFSARNLEFTPANLGPEIDLFLRSHDPVVFCYVSFRPEYRLSVLREGFRLLREHHPRAGVIWLGFPDKEMTAAREYASTFSNDEKKSLLLLGTVSHDAFLTLLQRCTVMLRTPACDGVAASVLESLALGVPVVASENGRRPAGVVTYAELDAVDMCQKLDHVLSDPERLRREIIRPTAEDNVGLTADWIAAR
jgi:glycosyltransferase involved in cell wall biosynthesis